MLLLSQNEKDNIFCLQIYLFPAVAIRANANETKVILPSCHHSNVLLRNCDATLEQ
jgi:hypothetical protein